MNTHPIVTVEIDHRAANALQPVAELPVAGTLAFLPNGNLLLLERRWQEHCVVVHEFAPSGAGDWSEVRAVTLKGVRGSPIGCAVSPDGARLAAGQKTAKVYSWPAGKAVASLPAVTYQLEYTSLGFSPSGALVVVADGGYISPRNRKVTVYDVATGDKRAVIKTDEWHFVQAMMLDESSVITLGLAVDWEFDDSETSGERVLGCYDAQGATVRFRRVLRGGQFVGMDPGARCVWVAGDTGPYAPQNLLSLAAKDGQVEREIAFADDWHADTTAPVVVGPATVALHVASYKHRVGRYVVIDAAAGRQVAVLGHPGSLNTGELPPAAHPATRRVAAVGRDKTFIWQLP